MSSSVTEKMQSIVKILLQLSLLLLFFWLGELLHGYLHPPISPAVIGLFLVLFGLFTGLFKLTWIKSGSDFILGELVLFFIPCFVGLIKYKALFLSEGWQLIVSVVVGTIVVMIVTAYSVHFGFRLETYLKKFLIKRSPKTHRHQSEQSS